MADRAVITPGAVRWSGAIWVALFLFWLPFEDVGTTASLFLAAMGALWLLLRWRSSRAQASLPAWILSGLLLGAAIPLMMIALAAFKSGLHAHGFADIPLVQLQRVVSKWIGWLVVGALVGGVGYLAENRLFRA